MQYRTHEASTLCNVTVNTVRNWCKDYGDFLSPSATGSSGNRLFTGRDLDVLKYIAQLRSENMQRSAILQRLGETTFAETDQPDQAVTLPIVQESTHTVQQSSMAQDYILAIDRRLETLEQAQRHAIYYMGIGFIGACLMFLLLISLAWLYAYH